MDHLSRHFSYRVKNQVSPKLKEFSTTRSALQEIPKAITLSETKGKKYITMSNMANRQTKAEKYNPY